LLYPPLIIITSIFNIFHSQQLQTCAVDVGIAGQAEAVKLPFRGMAFSWRPARSGEAGLKGICLAY